MPILARFSLSPVSRRTRVFALASALLISLSSPAVFAQTNAADDAAKRRRGTTDDNGRRGGSPEDMQARMMTSMRERFEVPDDEEWKIISERLGKVMELRRNSAGGGFGAIGAFAGRGQPTGDRGVSARRGVSGRADPPLTASPLVARRVSGKRPIRSHTQKPPPEAPCEPCTY